MNNIANYVVHRNSFDKTYYLVKCENNKQMIIFSSKSLKVVSDYRDKILIRNNRKRNTKKNKARTLADKKKSISCCLVSIKEADEDEKIEVEL